MADCGCGWVVFGGCDCAATLGCGVEHHAVVSCWSSALGAAGDENATGPGLGHKLGLVSTLKVKRPSAVRRDHHFLLVTAVISLLKGRSKHERG